MTRTVLEERTRMEPVDDSLVVIEEGSRISIMRGTEILATNDDGEMAKAARWATTINAIAPAAQVAAQVAVLGLGTGNILPLLYVPAIVHEIEPTLVEWFRGRYPTLSANHPFVVGDYRKTITGLYDVIVDDTGVEPPEGLLEAHLAPEGIILSWRDSG